MSETELELKQWYARAQFECPECKHDLELRRDYVFKCPECDHVMSFGDGELNDLYTSTLESRQADRERWTKMEAEHD